MQVVSLTRFGDADNFVDAEMRLPAVASGEVLIRVKAVGFNPIDHQIRANGFDGLTAPRVLGFDIAGVVEALGEGTSHFKIGDHVMAWLGGPSLAGGYAEFAAVPETLAALKPTRLSFIEAASVPLAALTAMRGLRRAGFSSDKSLLVAGGSGGVGSWITLLAKALGHSKCVLTAGSETSRQYIESHLGISHTKIVQYAGHSRDALAKAAIQANGGEYYAIALDCVGGAMTHLCCDVIDFEGAVVSFVNGPRDNSHPPHSADEDNLFNKSASFHFELIFAQLEYSGSHSKSPYTKDLRQISDFISAGKLQLPKVSEIGPLSAVTVRTAHEMLEHGHTTGKLVASIN